MYILHQQSIYIYGNNDRLDVLKISGIFSDITRFLSVPLFLVIDELRTFQCELIISVVKTHFYHTY